MTGRQCRYDPYLQLVNADRLKGMVRMWGGTSKLPKGECIAVIEAGLGDPAKVRSAVQNLDVWERNALAILKTFGNEIEAEVLNTAIWATGVKLPPRIQNPRWTRENALVEVLYSRGLVLSSEGDPGYFPSYSSSKVFTDERLTAEAGSLEVQSLELVSVPTPQQTLYRRPPTVALDIFGLLQAISDLGGLGLTKAGELRLAEVSKLRKIMKWAEDGIEIDGLFFPDPALAWVSAFRHSDLLELKGDFLILGETTECFAVRPYREQIQLVLDGFLRSKVWTEMPVASRYDNKVKYCIGRQALLIGLQSLPRDSHSFFSVDDFESALFDRIGENFSLGYLPNRPYSFHNKTPVQQAQELSEWHTQLRKSWLERERSWILAAFRTWAYFLGLVELSVKGAEIIGFRLTPLGRDVLHPGLVAKPEDSAGSPKSVTRSWVIQPNFEVVAYLDHISSAQLAFLERFTERNKVSQHTALFYLNRNSVYRGLESGATLNELLQGLERGAKTELPQNVQTELREWAALREQITLHHRARLLEFSGEQAMQRACQEGMTGKVVGERFFILTGEVLKSNIAGYQRKDYALPLPPCLNISEQGNIRIQTGYRDLWIGAQLDQWADRVLGGWQLTATSVANAIRSGKKLPDFLKLLAVRSKAPIPKFLDLALRAWSGEGLRVELGQVVILRCRDDEVFQALATSQQLRPYLKGIMDTNILLVNAEDFEKVDAILRWAGILVSQQLEVTKL